MEYIAAYFVNIFSISSLGEFETSLGQEIEVDCLVNYGNSLPNWTYIYVYGIDYNTKPELNIWIKGNNNYISDKFIRSQNRHFKSKT